MHLIILPGGVFERILTYVDLNGVKSLRLTNRKLAQMCIGPRFLNTIQQPTLDVSIHNLRALHALACNLTLSKMVHSLTFVATSLNSSELEKNLRSGTKTVQKMKGAIFSATNVPLSPEEISQSKFDLNWLKEQRKIRASESREEMAELLRSAMERFHKLDCIRLDAAAIIGCTQRTSTENGEWHPLWMRASFVFSLVITAIVQSGVLVMKLDAYRLTPRCCIPSGDITTYTLSLGSEHLTVLGENLESLEMSMSGEVKGPFDIVASEGEVLNECEELWRSMFPVWKGHLSREDPRALLADGTPGIASFLKSATSLRELNLSFRNTLREGKLDSYDRIIESIVCETHFPLLERCTLAGFFAKGESILLFLQKHPNIFSFTLQECTLTSGSWAPIFSHLEKSMPRLEKLSLSNLYGNHMQNPKHAFKTHCLEQRAKDAEQQEGDQEVYGLVNLQPIWDTNRISRRTSFPTAQGRFVHTRSFSRADVEKGMVFYPIIKGRGEPFNSPELMQWIADRRAVYGPP